MIKTTATYIILALILFGCKKQELTIEKESKRIEIRTTENHVWVDGKHVYTPALFYWKVGEIHEVKAYSSWGGSFANVSVTIYKDLLLDLEKNGRESVIINYAVQP